MRFSSDSRVGTWVIVVQSTNPTQAGSSHSLGRKSDRSRMGFGRCEIPAPRSSMLLSVRFGTNSAMTLGRFSTPSPLAALRFCPGGQDYEGSNIDDFFEAQSHGFSTRSIRFVPPSLTTTQCSLPAGGQPLPGGILFPLGPCIVFPRLVFFPITCFS